MSNFGWSTHFLKTKGIHIEHNENLDPYLKAWADPSKDWHDFCRTDLWTRATHLNTLSLCIQASFALFHHHCTYSFILCSWPITKLPSGGRREQFSAMGIDISQEKLEPVGATIRASQPYNRCHYIISNHIPIVSRIPVMNSAMISSHHLEVWFFLGAMGGVPHWHPPHRLWSCVSDGSFTGRSSAGGSS